MLESIGHDVRYVARSLVQQPGVFVLAVGILALGLCINTAVPAVAYGVLWRLFSCHSIVQEFALDLEVGDELGRGGLRGADAAGDGRAPPKDSPLVVVRARGRPN